MTAKKAKKAKKGQRVVERSDGGHTRITVRRKGERSDTDQRHGFLVLEVVAENCDASGEPCCSERIETNTVERWDETRGATLVEEIVERVIECDNPDPLPHRAPMKELTVAAGVIAEQGPGWLDEEIGQSIDAAAAAFEKYRAGVERLLEFGVEDQPTVERRVLARRLLGTAEMLRMASLDIERAKVADAVDIEALNAARRRIAELEQQLEERGTNDDRGDAGEA